MFFLPQEVFSLEVNMFYYKEKNSKKKILAPKKKYG